MTWFLIVTGGTYDYRVKIPVSIDREYQEYVVTSPVPSHAVVRLRGQGRHLLTFLIFEQARLAMALKWEKGEHVLQPGIENVQLTGNAKKLTVLDLEEPAAIPITIEKIATRKIPIEQRVKIKPLAGYTIVGDIRLDPAFATVRGPESSINSIDSIATRTEEWVDLKRPLQRQVSLIPPAVPFTHLMEQKITVSTEVQKLMEKKISQIPVRVINLPPTISASVIPPTISLVVEGGVDIVSSITAEDINAYIDYRREKNGQEKDYLAVIEDIPGVRPRDFEPERFKLILEILSAPAR